MIEGKLKLKIGIDPDVDKSGVAIIDGKDTFLKNLTFFELFDVLNQQKEREPTVYIECGFMNKSNWHKLSDKSASINTKIGERTGANFEVAKKIVEMCAYIGIEYVQIKPTKSKINSDTFKKITGLNIRTNQEQRDAYMLITGR
jgi:hypothetical protein